jgi:uncharacterized protein (DUF2147 family)
MRKLTFIFLFALAPFAALAADITGKWLTDEGKGHVVFEPCGSKICGTIVWLKDATDAGGNPVLDIMNANPSLRKRPLLGIMIGELEPDGNGGWKGKLYSPEEGSSFPTHLSIKKDGSLYLKGCGAGGLVCEDETWTRVE